MSLRSVLGFCLLLSFAIGQPVVAPALRLSSGAVRTDVKAVVTAQLKALQARDFDAAYTYAARGIKAQFDRPLFAALMERGYAPLLQHQSVEIGVVRDNGAGLAQVTVTVLDQRQRRTTYRYALVQEDGDWRIAGVVLEQSPLLGDT